MEKMNLRYLANFSERARSIGAKLLRCAFGMAIGISLFSFSANAETKVYVVKDNPNAAEPYNTWETAAATVKTATIFATNLVGTAQAESVEVLVGKGEYNNDNNIYLCAGVTLRGATGNRDDVIIGQSSYTSATTKRIVVAKGAGAVIADLTITGGYVYAHAGNSKYDYGGGVYLTQGAMITNCHITACTGHYGGQAAGLYVSSSYAYDTLVDKCVTKPYKSSSPIPTYGYAVYVTGNSVVDRCQIVDNKATGTKYDTNRTGGALCIYNSAASSTIVRNSLIARNSATYSRTAREVCMGSGVSIRYGTLENCTVISNIATDVSSNVTGGAPGVVLRTSADIVRNCHIAENYDGSVLKNYGITDGSASLYDQYNVCCTIPLHSKFVSCILDKDGTWAFDRKGRIRLIKDSPCIGGASQQTWMEGTKDLYGRDRKLYGKADIGAVEYVKPFGFNVIVR
ncbi:MAG: hypothetical protein IKC27_00310 [Kiritimatiellae bacterium]|nr:hypothetical protein [Kiritimatiellia bacterium]